jgi:hypothetical protein
MDLTAFFPGQSRIFALLSPASSSAAHSARAAQGQTPPLLDTLADRLTWACSAGFVRRACSGRDGCSGDVTNSHSLTPAHFACAGLRV